MARALARGMQLNLALALAAGVAGLLSWVSTASGLEVAFSWAAFGVLFVAILALLRIRGRVLRSAP